MKPAPLNPEQPAALSPPPVILRLARASLGPIGLLFLIDMVTNVTDYLFHLFLGRSLPPGDFASVQTVNAAVVILVTMFAVMQPAVARFVADAASTPGGESRARGFFQLFFRQGLLFGLVISLVVWLSRELWGRWLGVPAEAVAICAAMPLLALARPVVAGMLQGQNRFVQYGLTRTAFATSRLLLAVILIGLLGYGGLAGVAAIPLGAGVALLVGLLFLGRAAWHRAPRVPRQTLFDGWRLSLIALLAYAAFTSLQSLDLIWANRNFTAAIAGNYAALVVLRRVLAVLPGAAVVIFFPRVVAAVAQGRLPDRLLLGTAAVVAAATTALTFLYFAFGPLIIQIMFGSRFPGAAPLLGWMGVAMIGYGLAAIWLNLYLATRPVYFVVILVAVVALQLTSLSLYHAAAAQIVAAFAASGWLVAIAGLLLYLAWLRPWLKQRQLAANDTSGSTY